MKKRIRVMTSASRGEEKERQTGGRGGRRNGITAVERASGRMVQARASHPASRRRAATKNEEAVGRFARVATLSRERGEKTRWMTAKREKRPVDRATGRSNERRRERSAKARTGSDREGGEWRVGRRRRETDAQSRIG